MRITTRIAVGLFLMAALLIGAMSYQLSLVDRIQGINRELSLTNLEAARVSIMLVQGLEGVREFAAKASVLRDDEYREQWEEWEGAAERAMGTLRQLGLEAPEAALLQTIDEGWARYDDLSPLLWENPLLIVEVDALLDTLREDTEALIAVNQSSVAARAARSAGAGEQARLVARTATWSGLLLAGGASLFLFLSISGPLRRLTRGTRELAEGRFDHRLQTSGPAELASLANDFNHMAARLDELEELKRDFVSHVSHELKTPLAAVHETIEVLLDELPGPLTPRQRNLLELSRTSSARLGSMIGDLLEASRMEAGGIRWEPGWQDAHHIVDSVLEELQPLALDRSVHLEGPASGEGAPLFGDGDRIREVVGNLVGNALKFSPEGGHVKVGLSRCASLPILPGVTDRGAVSGETGPFLVLSVVDDGAGIPTEHRTRIFEKFHQVAGKRRLRGQGVGLGLSICRRIVEAHGGAIWADESPAGGALLQVLLPVEPAHWREAASEGASPEELHPVESVATERSTALSRRMGILLVALVLPLSGCATLPGLGRSAESPPGAGASAEPGAGGVDASRPIADVNLGEVRLSRGWAHLEGGNTLEARQSFDAALALELPPHLHAEALWGLALVLLAPDGDGLDLAEVEAVLRDIEAIAPSGLLRLQALWALEVIEEATHLQRTVVEREARIQELTDTLDMLRRIDLERRPAGGAAPGGQGGG